MAIGSFVKGFSEGFARTYAIKQEEERQERLLKKEFLLEEKKKREALEAKSAANHDIARGLQESFGLSQSQTNSIYFNVNSGIMTPEKAAELAQQYALENQNKVTSGVVTKSDEAALNTVTAVQNRLEGTPTNKLDIQTRQALGDLVDLPDNEQDPDIKLQSTSARTSTDTEPSLGYAASSMGLDRFSPQKDFGAKLFSDDNNRVLMELMGEGYLRPDQVMDNDARSNELFRVANNLRNDGKLVFTDDAQQELILAAIEQNPSIIGAQIKKVVPQSSMPGFVSSEEIRKSRMEMQDRLRDSGFSEEFVGMSGGINEQMAQLLKDKQEVTETDTTVSAAAPQDVQAIKDNTRRKSAEILLQDPVIKQAWANYIVQSEYERFLEEGDSDGVARTKALISYTAGAVHADNWDGTDKGLTDIQKVLKQQQGPVVKDTEGYWQRVSADEGLNQAISYARNSGNLPSEKDLRAEMLQNEVKGPEVKYNYLGMGRDYYTRSGNERKTIDELAAIAAYNARTDEQDELVFMSASDAGSRAQEARQPAGFAVRPDAAAGTEPVRTIPVGAKTIIPSNPNMVGFKTLTGNVPYAEAGLARMPNLVSTLTSMDLTAFDKVSPSTIEATIVNKRALAKIYAANNNFAQARQAELDANALDALLSERKPDPNAFLNSSIIGKKPEELANYMFQLTEYIGSGSTSEDQRAVAESRRKRIEDYLTFSPPEKFNYQDYQSNPVLYEAFLKQTNPALYEKAKPLFTAQVRADLLKDLDLSKFDGAEDLQLLGVYLKQANLMLEATPEEETQRRAKLNFQVETISAHIKGLKDKYPEKYDKETLITNVLISHSALKDAERQASEAAVSEVNPAIKQEKLRAYEAAKLQHANSLDALTQRAELEKIFSPDAKKDSWSEYVDSINKAESNVIRAQKELAEATNPAEKAAAAERLERVKLVRTQLYAAKEKQAAQTQRAEAEAFGVPVLMADGKINFVPADSVKEVEGAVRLQGNPSKIQEEINQSKARDVQRLTEANRAVETTLTVGSYAGELAEIVQQEPAVLTSLAGGASNFLTKLQAEYTSGEDLVLKSRVEELAREEGLLGETQSIDQLAGMSLSKMSDLAGKRSLFLAKQLQLIFASGGAEGTAGNAMSNQDFNNLRSVISANSTRNPQTYLANLRGYVSTKESQSTSLVNSLRTTGILSNYIQAISPNKEYADAYIRNNTPATIQEYIKNRSEDVRAVNYQKLFAQNAATVSKTKQETMDLRSRNLLVQTGVSEENINKVMQQLNAAVNISKTAADIDQAKRLLIQEWGSKYNVNPQLSKRILDMYLPLATGK